MKPSKRGKNGSHWHPIGAAFERSYPGGVVVRARYMRSDRTPWRASVCKKGKRVAEVGATDPSGLEEGIGAALEDLGIGGYRRNRRMPKTTTVKWIGKAITHPGKLGGKGFMGKTVAEQRAILDRCVRMKQYGYRSCLGSVQLLENISKNPAHKERLGGLRRYLVAKYSPNRARYRRNPDDGSWKAVPVIVVPFDIRGVKLTRAQIEEITVYT